MRSSSAHLVLVLGALLGAACSSSAPAPTCSGSACDATADTVFVAPDGKDANPGTKQAPVATVRAAFRLAASTKRLHVVLADGTYNEDTTLAWVDGVKLEGGFARKTWLRDKDATSELAGATIAVVATGLASGGTVSHVLIRARSSLTPDVPSVALWVNDLPSGKVFRVEDGATLLAGAGADGLSGPNGHSPGARDGGRGVDGHAGTDSGVGGEGGRSTACPAADGGAGGAGGQTTSSFRGSDGRASAAGVAGGKGADANGCTARDGEPATVRALQGAGGASGVPGGDVGEWDAAALRYKPPVGAGGGPGAPGQGGGGGGGGSGQTGALCKDGPGSGGGGGGAGGCGGAGGGGGGGGGPSVALLVTKASVVVDTSVLGTDRGGAGGEGGAGEAGGLGGAGGAGATQGAPEIGRGGDGESGADGGHGGVGGAGAGGPSVGLWVLAGDAQTKSVTFQVGPGGVGGANAKTPGKPGIRADLLR